MDADLFGGVFFKSTQKRTILPPPESARISPETHRKSAVPAKENGKKLKKNKTDQKKKSNREDKKLIKPVILGDIAEGKTFEDIQWHIKKNVLNAVTSSDSPRKPKPKPKTSGKAKTIKKTKSDMVGNKQPRGKMLPVLEAHDPSPKKNITTTIRLPKSHSVPVHGKVNTQDVRRAPRRKPKSIPKFLPTEYVGMKKAKMPVMFTPTGRRLPPRLPTVRNPPRPSFNLFEPQIFPSPKRNALSVVYTRDRAQKIQNMQRARLEREKGTPLKNLSFVYPELSKRTPPKKGNSRGTNKKCDVIEIMNQMKKFKGKAGPVRSDTVAVPDVITSPRVRSPSPSAGNRFKTGKNRTSQKVLIKKSKQ